MKTRDHGSGRRLAYGREAQVAPPRPALLCVPQSRAGSTGSVHGPVRGSSGRGARVAATWLAAPGARGRVRKDTKVRRVRPSYGFTVPGFPAAWIEVYRERWDHLEVDPNRP